MSEVGRHIQTMPDAGTSDGHNGGAGNYIAVVGSGFRIAYLHMCRFVDKGWKVGDSIKAGDVIGYMGNTGHSFGKHLHFMCRKESDHTHVLNPMFYIYDRLINSNIRGGNYNTSVAITNCVLDGAGNARSGKFSPSIKINDISDYAGYVVRQDNNIDNSPLLIVIGGWTSSGGATRVWAEGLKTASSILKDFNIVAYDYGAINPKYPDSDPLGMTVLASRIKSANPTKIYIVGHSSGAFAAYFLIKKLDKDINKSTVKLFVLDESDGITYEVQSPNSQFNGSVAVFPVVSMNKEKNIASMNYYHSKFDNVPNYVVINNTSDKSNYLHSGMIVKTLATDAKDKYNLNDNYRNVKGGGYITEWIK